MLDCGTWGNELLEMEVRKRCEGAVITGDMDSKAHEGQGGVLRKLLNLQNTEEIYKVHKSAG